jgi:hypothetical protein
LDGSEASAVADRVTACQEAIQAQNPRASLEAKIKAASVGGLFHNRRPDRERVGARPHFLGQRGALSAGPCWASLETGLPIQVLIEGASSSVARRATLRPHHTPGQPNRSGVEGRRFDRIVHNRTSWQKPARAGRRSVRLMADGWQREFDEPIETPEGTELWTLREAIATSPRSSPNQNAICRRSRRLPRKLYQSKRKPNHPPAASHVSLYATDAQRSLVSRRHTSAEVAVSVGPLLVAYRKSMFARTCLYAQ